MANNNTSIATESTRTAAIQNTADYTDGIAAHLAGDWVRHNELNLLNAPWFNGPGPPDRPRAAHVITSAIILRLVAMNGDTELTAGIPVIASGPFIGSGTFSGSPQAVAPTFVMQPASASYLAGARVVLSVSALGTPPILLQWSKDGAALEGETSSDLVIAAFSSTDVGDYVCTATNSVGQVQSDTASAGLKTSTAETVPTRII